MKIQSAVLKVWRACLSDCGQVVHRAVVYLSPKEVVRATRILYGKKPRSGENIDIRITVGRPNHRERAFIKLAKKAGCVFPIRKVQLQLLRTK